MARICLAFALVLALPLFAAMPADAQTRIVAVVNGDAITSYDLSQRERLLRLTGQRGNLRENALQELIDEAIQNRAVKAARIRVSDGDVDRAISDIASRAKISTQQLSGAFRQAGVSMGTLRERIKSQIGFSQLVRARFQANARVTEQDLVAALLRDDSLEKRVDTPRYRLHQVTIAMPENPSADRKRRAQGRAAELRRGFQSCTSGLPMARKTRNVVVQDMGYRMGIEFNQSVRDKLDATALGKLSEPVEQRRGLVMFAICEKEMVASSNAAMKALEGDMTSERGEAFQKQYLRQLRRDAVVERRG